MIPFNKPPVIGTELNYISEALESSKLSGDGFFGKECQTIFEHKFGIKKTLLTPSCTAALEMAALLIDIQPGDEVIMPSYTFVSTANAFVLRGASIVFVDIRPDTMNIDETLIEAAITDKTKAIVPVHYAGVACEMDVIMDIAERHNLYVIEDAAQGVMSSYKGRSLGSIGHLAAFSFHETKNYSSGGEGGLLLINDEEFIQQAEIIREKGTNRSLFFRGQVDKYTWVNLGSSFLPSEIQSAFLYSQIKDPDIINNKRMLIWNYYYNNLKSLMNVGSLELPFMPEYVQHNAHMFYIKVSDISQRTKLIEFMKEQGVMLVFHYIPLHSAPGGLKYGRFSGNDVVTTKESERLVRLPLYYSMTENEMEHVVSAIHRYFEGQQAVNI